MARPAIPVTFPNVIPDDVIEFGSGKTLVPSDAEGEGEVPEGYIGIGVVAKTVGDIVCDSATETKRNFNVRAWRYQNMAIRKIYDTDTDVEGWLYMKKYTY